MRRIALTGLALICIIALGSLAATREPRSTLIEAASSQNPQPVAVTNFPAVQGVTGTVNVGNLPAVQNVEGTVQVANLPAVQSVSGTVAVGNLPLDADGNLRTVAIGAPRSLRFLGFTSTTLTGGAGALAFDRACHNEFPGSRECSSLEVVEGVDPALASGMGWIRPAPAVPIYAAASNDFIYVDPVSGIAARTYDLACTAAGGRGLAINDAGQFTLLDCSATAAVACCGF